jgi:hypothetical protein
LPTGHANAAGQGTDQYSGWLAVFLVDVPVASLALQAALVEGMAHAAYAICGQDHSAASHPDRLSRPPTNMIYRRP